MTQASTARRASDPSAAPSAAAPADPGGRRLEVRGSLVHGRGVFARRPLREGERVVEYTGEIISWKEAQRRHPHDPEQPDHTFYFHLDDSRVIDGLDRGNIAKWINHACGPNCEAEQDGDRVFLYALRDIAPGEELSFDYGLVIDERMTPALKARFACRCGTPACRGTMLAPPVRKRAPAAKPAGRALAKKPAGVAPATKKAAAERRAPTRKSPGTREAAAGAPRRRRAAADADDLR